MRNHFKKLFILSAIVSMLAVNANAQTQIIDNVEIGANASPYGVKIKSNGPGYNGGWSRAFTVGDSGNNVFCGFGSFGTAVNGVATHLWSYIGPDYNAAYMTFLPNGNVGIGSYNPDERLSVKGKIHAEEIRVDLLVPADYVFEKYYTGVSSLKSDYTMPTLAEVEKFTKENNHLPNIPSAAEIKANGLLLGEMNNALLQKIEELTLYIIEQNKRIEALEAKVNNK